MATTIIEIAKKKYAGKTDTMAENYVAAISDAVGFNIGNSSAAMKYRAKITPATAEKWATNYVNSFRD